MTDEKSWREQLEFMNRVPFYQALSNVFLRGRAEVMAKVGTTFGGDRRVYEVFGWPLDPTYLTYEHLYQRGGIAKRIVQAYPQAAWRSQPTISEDGDPGTETAFELDWMELVESRLVYHYLMRANTMARLGEYSVLFMGFNDGATAEQLDQPVGAVRGATPRDRLLYLKPYHQTAVQVLLWDEDPSSERFGQPNVYQLQYQTPLIGNKLSQRTFRVHHTRVIHIAEDVLEDDLAGQPCLQAVLNMLLDLEKTCGASAEAFFQQWPPGMTMKADKDANIDTTQFQDGEAGQQMIQDFIHGFKRWLILQGIEINSLQPALGDPSKVTDVLIELIAGTTGIPKRILLGSERGELSSEQDETNWNKRIEEYQQNWAEPFLLRPFIDSMIAKGVIKAPGGEGKYDVEWKESTALGEQVRAEIAQKKAAAIAAYASAPGAVEVVPQDVFLSEVMGFSEEVVEKCQERLEDMWDKDLEEMNPSEPELPEQGQQPPAVAPVKEEQPPPTIHLTDNYDPHQPRDRRGRWTAGGGAGGGFVSRGEDGKWQDEQGNTLSSADQERLKKVPKAWTDVELNPDPNAALQVVGKDAKGRSQYLYSAAHSEAAAAKKFSRLNKFDQALPGIRQSISADMAKGNETAAMLHLIDRTGFRVGSTADTKAAKQAYGASTLTGKHVSIDGDKLTFNFTGKKGVEISKTITDKPLADFLRSKAGTDKQLFNSTDAAARKYLKSVGGNGFKVKDFRTWNGTNVALKTMSGMPKPSTVKELKASKSAVAKAVAKHLGNTPAVALSSYINPTVFREWEM